MENKPLYEGKAKQIFATDNPNEYRVYFKDDATAFNAQKKGTIIDKGIFNNKISNYFFKLLESKGIETHFIKEISDRETIVKKVEIIPVEVIIRNIVAGSMSRRLGIEEGYILAQPTIEFSYKNDDLGDPLVSMYYIPALNWATQKELDKMIDMAFRINEILKEKMLSIGIKLVDFKLEFGRYNDDVILADEISPDTCRFWDAETNKKLDKDRFRRDLGEVESAYQEIYNRLTNS